MNIGTPQSSAGVAPGAVAEDRLSEQLTAVVTTARRRAARGGDREVDTAHLLHSLLEEDPEVRAPLGGGGPRTAKLLAYLAQRSIGYGLRWRYAVEETPAAADAGGAAGAAGAGPLSGWSPAAARAMRAALERVAARGAVRAEGVDLLAGLAADPDCRAAEVLGRIGVDVRGLAAALDGGANGVCAGTGRRGVSGV